MYSYGKAEFSASLLTNAHMCLKDHANIIGPIANGESDWGTLEFFTIFTI